MTGFLLTIVNNYFPSGRKNGFNVNQASAGKKIIGTASPGKSSGFLIDKGREIEIGIMTAVKERIEINRL
jgi:hypothetical protein